MNYKHILVPLDGSELAECVVFHLETMVSENQVTTVELVRVVPPIELHYKAALPISANQEKRMNQALVKEAEGYLQKVKVRLNDSYASVTTKVLVGPVADALADYLEKSGADLLVMATHGRSGPSRWVWGSVADRLLHVSHVPVFLVPALGCSPG